MNRDTGFHRQSPQLFSAPRSVPESKCQRVSPGGNPDVLLILCRWQCSDRWCSGVAFGRAREGTSAVLAFFTTAQQDNKPEERGLWRHGDICLCAGLVCFVSPAGTKSPRIVQVVLPGDQGGRTRVISADARVVIMPYQ